MKRTTHVQKLRDLAATMKELGIATATLADGTSATLAPEKPAPPVTVSPMQRTPPPPQSGCICGHHLSAHDGSGECLKRGPDNRPCQGPCGPTDSNGVTQ